MKNASINLIQTLDHSRLSNSQIFEIIVPCSGNTYQLLFWSKSLKVMQVYEIWLNKKKSRRH